MFMTLTSSSVITDIFWRFSTFVAGTGRKNFKWTKMPALRGLDAGEKLFVDSSWQAVTGTEVFMSNGWLESERRVRVAFHVGHNLMTSKSCPAGIRQDEAKRPVRACETKDRENSFIISIVFAASSLSYAFV